LAQTYFSTHRAALLASVAGLAIAGVSWDARAQTAFTNVAVLTNTVSFFTLNLGDSLTNTAAGSLTITPAGTQPAVVTGANGAAFILNQGTIQSQQDPGGIAISIVTLTSLGTITNSGTGLIQTNGVSGVGIAVAGGLTTLLNSANILASGASGSGVKVVSGGSVGALNNAIGGSIVSSGSLGTGVLVTGGTISTLTNNGSIVASGPGGTAVAVGQALFSGTVGTITNGTTGLIAATGVKGVGLDVETAVGFIDNSGSISGGSAAGGTAINLGTASVVTSLTNESTGTISADGSVGVAVNIAGNMAMLLNLGQIVASGAGGSGVNVVSGASVGTITNTGGTIQATGSLGTAVGLGGTVTALNNTGLIQSTGSNGTGVAVMGLVTNLNNAGTIQSTGAGGMGVTVASTALLQSLTNTATGTISANGSLGTAVGIAGILTNMVNNGQIQANGASGTGVNVAASANMGQLTNNAGGTIVAGGTGVTVVGALGTITNGGLIQGGPANGSGTAINSSASTAGLTVANTGSIVGAVVTGSNSTVNLNAGTVTGNIAGNEINNVVNFNGGTVSAGFTISTVSAVNINTGAITVNPTTGVSIVDVTAFNIASGATVNLAGGTIGISELADPGVLNNGVINLGSGVASITGNYSQGATGQLQIIVTNTGAGSLNVGGSATISSTGTAFALHFTGLSGPSSFVALTATGGVTASLALTASSDSVNPYFDFPTVSQTPTTLIVNFPAPTVPQLNNLYGTVTAGATGGLTSSGGLNQIAAIGGVQGLLDSLLIGNDRANLTNVFVALRTMTQAQQVQFFSQVQPSQIGAAIALLSSALTNNGGLMTSIGDRVYAMRDTSGMAAGDGVGRGFTVWAKPYGETLTQDRKEGVDGFRASMYGLAAGADTLIRPDIRLGGAVSLSNADINFNGLQSGNTASDLLFQAGVYGSYFSGNFFVDGVAAFGLHWFDTKENISAFGSQRKSEFSGVQFSTKLTAGYDWHMASGMIVTPSATFQEIHVDADAHQTTGAGVFNLNVSDQHIDVTQLKLGGRVAYPMSQPNGWSFTPEVHAFYVRNLTLSRVQSTAAFTSGGAFTVSGPQRDPDLADFGIGLTIAQKGPFALSAVYDYTFGQTSSDNQFYLRVKTEF
jgi:uncharacterized protein with beta-barrel porin domain